MIMLIRSVAAEDCYRALARANFGRLACEHEGQPYVVPVFFAVDPEQRDYLYLFSLLGQKIEWLRANPLACIQVDHVEGPTDWMSIVALGRYEELPDIPEKQAERKRAHQLLEGRASWWEPGLVGIGEKASPAIFYRIKIEQISGRIGKRSPDELDLRSSSPTPDPR